MIFGRGTLIDKGIISFESTKKSSENQLHVKTNQNAPQKLPIRLVSVTSAELNQKGKEPAHWSLQLDEPLTKKNTVGKGERAYLRVRFITRKPERIWTWMNGRTVGIADFRIGDTREIIARNSRDTLDILEKWFVPIKKVRVFLIVPCYLLFRTASPEVYYMRMFEGNRWKKYLDRSVNLFRNDKMMIYQWRNKEKEEINIKDNQTEAFKSFIVLSKQGVGYLEGILITAIIVFLLFYFSTGSSYFNTISSKIIESGAYKSTAKFFEDYIVQYGYYIAFFVILIRLILWIPKVNEKYIKFKSFIYIIEDTAYYIKGILEDMYYFLKSKYFESKKGSKKDKKEE